MQSFQLKPYIEAQIEEINKYKWIESEKEHSDIGIDRAAKEWINKYAELFSSEYFGMKIN